MGCWPQGCGWVLVPAGWGLRGTDAAMYRCGLVSVLPACGAGAASQPAASAGVLAAPWPHSSSSTHLKAPAGPPSAKLGWREQSY